MRYCQKQLDQPNQIRPLCINPNETDILYVTSSMQSLPSGYLKTRAHTAFKNLLTSQKTPLEHLLKQTEQRTNLLECIHSCKFCISLSLCSLEIQHMSSPVLKMGFDFILFSDKSSGVLNEVLHFLFYCWYFFFREFIGVCTGDEL